MNRIIKCRVENEYIRGAGQVIGAAGSHNDVELELEFNEVWHGTSRKIMWFNALGEDPVETLLTVDLLVPGEPENYRVPVPAECKALAGEARITIQGVNVEGEVETRAVVAATATFKVLEAMWDPNAEAAGDVTPTAADQLQAEIEGIKEELQQLDTAVETAETAAAAAEAAIETVAGDAARAETAASAAVLAAGAAESAADDAAGSKNAAAASEDAAQAARTAAETAQEVAETAAGTAAVMAGNAVQSADDALASSDSAGQSATAAQGAAQAADERAEDAMASKQAAAASEQAAARSETEAENSATEAESWAVGGTGTREGENTNNAKYWAGQAQNAAGGGVTSFNGRSGAVMPQAGDYGSEQGLAELDENGKVKAEQLPEMDYANRTLSNLTSTAEARKNLMIPNRNLLRNPRFKVNQLGRVSGSNSSSEVTEVVDGWRIDIINNVAARSYEITENGISITNKSPTGGGGHIIAQTVPRNIAEYLKNKTVTISVLFQDGTFSHNTVQIPDSDWPKIEVIEKGGIRLRYEDLGGIVFRGGVYNETISLKAIKMEIGDTQTLAYQDENGDWQLYDDYDYNADLLECMRYYQVSATTSWRASKAKDFRPPMAAEPTLGTVTVNGTTLYFASATP